MKLTVCQLQDVLRNNVTDVEDLITLLDLSVEDIIDRFPDQIKLREGHIVGVYPDETDEAEAED